VVVPRRSRPKPSTAAVREKPKDKRLGFSVRPGVGGERDKAHLILRRQGCPGKPQRCPQWCPWLPERKSGGGSEGGSSSPIRSRSVFSRRTCASGVASAQATCFGTVKASALPLHPFGVVQHDKASAEIPLANGDQSKPSFAPRALCRSQVRRSPVRQTAFVC